MTTIPRQIGMTLVKLPFLIILLLVWAVIGLAIGWLWADELPWRSGSTEALEDTASSWPAGFVGIWKAFFGPGSQGPLPPRE